MGKKKLDHQFSDMHRYRITNLVKGSSVDTEEEARITISVPVSLRKLLKIRAVQNDRSYSGEIVHCLKRGAEWKPQDPATQK